MNPKLQALSDDPQLKPLWYAVHDRLCAGTDPAAIRKIVCGPLPRDTVALLQSMLDRPGSLTTHVKPAASGGVQVPIRRLMDALDVDVQQLATAAERAVGRPVVDRTSEAAERRRQRDEAFAWARQRLAIAPAVADAWQAAGLRSDVDTFRRDVAVVGWCLDRLPATRPLTRQKLAHDATAEIDGEPDAHALDGILGERVLVGGAQLLGTFLPQRPAAQRHLWSQLGVHPDLITTATQTCRLVVAGDGLVDRRLADAAPHGAPVGLTWWDLTHCPPTFTAGQTVTVVENPSALAEVLLAEVDVGPVVCTSGQLTAVDDLLLGMLAAAGAHLLYVGDRDEHGRQIAQRTVDWYGAQVVDLPNSVIFEEHDEVTRWLQQPAGRS